MKNEIDSYLNDLEHLSLNDSLINGVEKSAPVFDAFKSLFYLILGFPVFIFGFVTNFLPFKIPGWVATRISTRREFFGSISITMGTLTFLIFYSLQIWLLTKFVNDWRFILGYIFLLPLSGLFAFYYFKRFTTLRGNWKVFSLFYKKTKLIISLISKRQTIIEQLEKGKEEFISQRDGSSNSMGVKLSNYSEDVNDFFNLNN